MYRGDGDEAVRFHFGETIQHSPNAHAGIDQYKRNVCFAEGEYQ